MTRASGRDVARRVLRRIDREDAYSSLALGAELSRSDLSPADRRLATELVYGVLRYRDRLDRAVAAFAPRGLAKLPPGVRIALRVGAYQIVLLDRVPAHAAVSDAVGAARQVAGPRVGGFVNGVLRKLSTQGEPAFPAEPRARLEIEESMPAWLVGELARRLPDDELAAAAAGMNQAAPLWARARPGQGAKLADTLRGEGEGVRAEPSKLCPDAVAVHGLGSPERSASFAAGAWTVQDLGAQLVGHMVSRDARRVLDACAGVGGKATHLAERLGAGAVIDAADASARKLELLGDTARRLGVTAIRPIAVDLTAAGDALAGDYDAVVLDAPCSGLGVTRRHPERKWRSPRIAELAALQRRLLDAVAQRVRPGGELVYSVCTFTDAEGPAQIARFLAEHDDFAIAAPPASDGGPSWPAVLDEHGAVVTWPHRHDADAFFAVRLVRRAG